jgi:formamidopyrimidine-DNA glycosylase
MPEAAEVTVAGEQLAACAVGRELVALDVTHPRTSRAQPPEALQVFAGHRIDAVTRHGKWLVVTFDGLVEQLGVHLRMSGQLLAQAPRTPHPDRHVHAVLHLSPLPKVPSVPQTLPEQLTEFSGGAGVEVWFRDPRTFGELRLLANGAPGAPDLFDARVDGVALAAATARCTVGVKAVLLDQQRAVSGIGSYLADEALHRAGISPLRPANHLTVEDWERALAAARSVAEESAAIGGVTLPDEGWVDLCGRPGRYAAALRVHGRDACVTCGTPTSRAQVGGRSARWCPACQPK